MVFSQMRLAISGTESWQGAQGATGPPGLRNMALVCNLVSLPYVLAQCRLTDGVSVDCGISAIRVDGGLSRPKCARHDSRPESSVKRFDWSGLALWETQDNS